MRQTTTNCVKTSGLFIVCIVFKWFFYGSVPKGSQNRTHCVVYMFFMAKTQKGNVYKSNRSIFHLFMRAQ